MYTKIHEILLGRLHFDGLQSIQNGPGKFTSRCRPMEISSESFATIRQGRSENGTLPLEHYKWRSRVCLHSDLNRDDEASCKQRVLDQWD